MDKIYSRKRIHLPKLYIKRFSKKSINIRNYITAKFAIILIIAIVVMFTIINGINPIIDRICLDVSKSKATSIANKKTTDVMSGYSYEDIITIYRDNENKITMIKSNITVINEITSNIAIKIQEGLEKESDTITYIRMGSLTGTRVLSGMGPSIPIKLSTTGNVITSIRSEFESSGINQTIHRLYLDITCNVSVLTPYNVVEESIKNEIMIIENVIVGIVPTTYYNLEGMEKKNSIDIIE